MNDDEREHGVDDERGITRRLHDALVSRADEVTEADLAHSFVELERSVSAPRRTRGGWLGAAAAAAAAVVVVAGATGVAVVTRHGDLTPLPVATQTVTAAPAPTPLVPSAIQPLPNAGAGTGSVTAVPPTAAPGVAAKEEPRSAIPWGHVGLGWTAAVWSATNPATEGTLYLMSPSGVRYAVGQVVANTEVADVTYDGRRILTRGVGDAAGHIILLEWDVATGTFRSVPLPPNATQAISYTKPSGAAILVQTEEAGGSRVDALERYDLRGALQLRYPVKAGNGPDNSLDRLQTPDGRDLVIKTGSGLVLVGNDGTIVRTLSLPTGVSSCRPAKWWSAEVFLAVCDTSRGPTAGNTPNLWLIPTSGAAATALTKAPKTLGDPGFTNAWKYSQGTILERSSACGTYSLATLNAAGSGDDLKLNVAAPGVDNGPVIDAIIGDTAVVDLLGCQGDPGLSLIAYDLLTKTSTALLGPLANGGTVASFLVIDTTR